MSWVLNRKAGTFGERVGRLQNGSGPVNTMRGSFFSLSFLCPLEQRIWGCWMERSLVFKQGGTDIHHPVPMPPSSWSLLCCSPHSSYLSFLQISKAATLCHSHSLIHSLTVFYVSNILVHKAWFWGVWRQQWTKMGKYLFSWRCRCNAGLGVGG